MTQWRKSGRSADTGQENCVELARLPPAIGVRDSRLPEAGHLILSHESFADLITRIKRDELNF
ncbi:DUF397 domain-containing protein [Spirillospora albida]|uniref:DUF397 domain-containing protein n=1 Tax=Spirillospora albida TaxID=58123 RepID=UPI0004BFB403|nr:DUF397 domain-containing protein [Spirillospora albida]